MLQRSLRRGRDDGVSGLEKQIPSLRYGMTARKASASAKANAGVYPLRCASVEMTKVGAGLFLGGYGLAFLDVVLVPGGDLGDVGAWLFDDALAAEAGVQLKAGGEVEAVEFEVFGFGDSFGSLLEEHVAGGAGGDSSTGVVHKDAVVFRDVEEAHGLAVAVVGEGVERELDGFIFRLEGDADDVLGGRLGQVDFRESGFVIGHGFSSLVRVGTLCREEESLVGSGIYIPGRASVGLRVFA